MMQRILLLLAFAAWIGFPVNAEGGDSPLVLTFCEAGDECATGTCGIQKAEFATISIPEDMNIDVRRIGIADIDGDVQRVTVTITDSGIKPAVLVVKREIPGRILFRNRTGLETISLIVPTYNRTLPMSGGSTAVEVAPEFDFTALIPEIGEYFFVHVVDSLKSVKAAQVKAYVERYNELVGSFGE